LLSRIYVNVVLVETSYGQQRQHAWQHSLIKKKLFYNLSERNCPNSTGCFSKRVSSLDI